MSTEVSLKSTDDSRNLACGWTGFSQLFSQLLQKDASAKAKNRKESLSEIPQLLQSFSQTACHCFPQFVLWTIGHQY